MDGGLDSVEKAVPFMPAERVNPLHRSEREKERKFAQTLEEELEEEKKKSREAHEQDQVTLSSDAGNQQPQPQKPDEEQPGEEDSDKPGEASKPGPEDGHIDLKA